jgi:hypothetical protein
MAVLSYAYDHDKENVWFSLLTDSCVPIISPEKFREMFMNHYQASIIKCKPAYWDIRLHWRANLRLLSKEFWLANDPWFTLCRDHVQKCILFLAYKNSIYMQINKGGIANESIFAIILQTFGELQNPMRLINESATMSDWTRMASPTSPHLFKEASEEEIKVITNLLKENKYAMFLRKVDKLFPDDAIKSIMNTDFNHTYDVLHNHAKKTHKSFFCSNLQYFIILIAFIYFITSAYTESFMKTDVFSP